MSPIEQCRQPASNLGCDHWDVECGAVPWLDRKYKSVVAGARIELGSIEADFDHWKRSMGLVRTPMVAHAGRVVMARPATFFQVGR